MRRFYDQFGWPPSQHNDDSFAAYRCGGAVLGLFGAENYTKAYGPLAPPGTFRGVVLSIDCRDAAEVDRVYDALQRIDGVTLHGEPQDLLRRPRLRVERPRRERLGSHLGRGHQLR